MAGFRDSPPSAAAGQPFDLTVAALGLLVLDAIFLLLVGLSETPRVRAPEARVMLEAPAITVVEAAPEPLRGRPREVVVRIGGSEPLDPELPLPKPEPRLLALVPIREYRVEITGPPPVLRLIDGTGEAPGGGPAEADRLMATAAAIDRPDEIAASGSWSSGTDALLPSPDAAPAMTDVAVAAVFPSVVDRLEPAPTPLFAETESSAVRIPPIVGPPPPLQLVDGTGQPPGRDPALSDHLIAAVPDDLGPDETAGPAAVWHSTADALPPSAPASPLLADTGGASFRSRSDGLEPAAAPLAADAGPRGDSLDWAADSDRLAATPAELTAVADEIAMAGDWQVAADALDPASPARIGPDETAGTIGWQARADALAPAAPPVDGHDEIVAAVAWAAVADRLPQSAPARPITETGDAVIARAFDSRIDNIEIEKRADPASDELALASRAGWAADADRLIAAAPAAPDNLDELAIPPVVVAAESDLLIPSPPAAALVRDETADPRAMPAVAAADRLAPSPAQRAGDRDEIAAASLGDWTVGNDALPASAPSAPLVADETASGVERPVALADTIPAVPFRPLTAEESLFVAALDPSWELGADETVEAEAEALALASLPDPGLLRPGVAVEASSVKDLAGLFDSHDYRRFDASVPSLYLYRLPSDIASVDRADTRKALFIRTLLPLVVSVNERTLRLRARVEALVPQIEQDALINPSDVEFLTRVMEEFGLSRWDTAEMLRRLDVVPPSLALAQAAEESGWGTSRAAREDNALFGQMMFVGSTGQLKPFDDLTQTVKAYIRNLNTHRAYAEMRRHRASLRAAGKVIDGHSLASHLVRYSERGNAYIRAIQGLMDSNNFQALDQVKLREQLVETAVP